LEIRSAITLSLEIPRFAMVFDLEIHHGVYLGRQKSLGTTMVSPIRDAARSKKSHQGRNEPVAKLDGNERAGLTIENRHHHHLEQARELRRRSQRMALTMCKKSTWFAIGRRWRCRKAKYRAMMDVTGGRGPFTLCSLLLLYHSRTIGSHLSNSPALW
jgi:hypothetical protein